MNKQYFEFEFGWKPSKPTLFNTHKVVVFAEDEDTALERAAGYARWHSGKKPIFVKLAGCGTLACIAYTIKHNNAAVDVIDDGTDLCYELNRCGDIYYLKAFRDGDEIRGQQITEYEYRKIKRLRRDNDQKAQQYLASKYFEFVRLQRAEK